MVVTGETQTIEEWAVTPCGAALVSWLTPITPTAPATNQSLNQECIVSGVATCGTATTSLCPCSASQTSLYLYPLSNQSTLIPVLETTSGACYGTSGLSDPLNTTEGIMMVIQTTPGKTLWDFENQSTCGTALVALTTARQTDPVTIQPVLDECFDHGDHGLCGTTSTSLCPCTPSVDIIYNIPTASVTQFDALTATNGVCSATPPSTTAVFATVMTNNGLQLYVQTAPGSTQYDFENSTCGIEVYKIQDSVLSGPNAEETVHECWEHVDHAHCGADACPCPVPESLVVTAVEFTMNVTHTSTEGLLYFNNYFMTQVRANPDCKFSRYLATYADGLGYVLKVYIDQLPATCDEHHLEEINAAAFKTYWEMALVRFAAGGGAAEEEEDDHAGHNHFQIQADDHDHDHDHGDYVSDWDPNGPYVAGIISIHVGEAMNLDVASCWNPTTDGLFCVAQSSQCTQILCPLDTHCHSNDECGTGVCGERVVAAPEEEDDHAGHNHNVARDVIVKVLSAQRSINNNKATQYGINILEVDHHDHDDHAHDDSDAHPDWVCTLKVNGASSANYFIATILVALIIAVAL